jgi:phosphoribosylanthranilate isomerase
VKTFVKFCGLKDPATFEAIPDGGAAGFVINVPDSPRNLTPEQATQLVDKVPAEAEVWGVVVNPTSELIHRLFDDVGVDRIQVYGTIPTGLEFLEIHHLVPSLPIPPPGGEGKEPVIPPAEDYPRLHLDAAGQPTPGGSGVRPDWEICAKIVDSQPGRKFVLAGGLTADNVVEALALVRPWGVDVSTGVESAPGVKDVMKMKAFIDVITEFEQAHA